MFSKVFNKNEHTSNDNQYITYKLLNGYQDSFTWADTSNIHQDATVRTCIDTIARNVSKLKPKHIRKVNGTIKETDSTLSNLLSVRPNPYMNAFDFYYKIASHLYMFNNAFVYIQTVKGEIIALYPVPYNQMELKEYNGEMYCKFWFCGGQQVTLPYTDMIHLRRHYSENEFFGDDQSNSLRYNLTLFQTCKQGLENAIKNSTKIRGVLKFLTNLSPSDIEKQHQKFTENYLNISTSSGIAAVDTKMEFQQLTSDITTAEHTHFKFFQEEIYKCFGINESIIQSKYTEDEWNAFYESVIEPIAVQLSLEFTSKLFTEREKGHGNEIVFEANRLQYASASTKYKMIKDLMPLGILSVNEAREILNMAAIEDGDKRQISLNYVDANKQNQYQLGEQEVKNVDEQTE